MPLTPTTGLEQRDATRVIAGVLAVLAVVCCFGVQGPISPDARHAPAALASDGEFGSSSPGFKGPPQNKQRISRGAASRWASSRGPRLPCEVRRVLLGQAAPRSSRSGRIHTRSRTVYFAADPTVDSPLAFRTR